VTVQCLGLVQDKAGMLHVILQHDIVL